MLNFMIGLVIGMSVIILLIFAANTYLEYLDMKDEK